MSVKWYLLKELKLSFKTPSLNDFNDSFKFRNKSSMSRKVEGGRTLPGRSRVSLSTGQTFFPRSQPRASSTTVCGDKDGPGAFTGHR